MTVEPGFNKADFRTSTFVMLIVGLLLIVMLPLHGALVISENQTWLWQNVLPFFINSHDVVAREELLSDVRWWEAIAIFWTAVLTVTFFLFDFAKVYGPSEDPATNMSIGNWMTFWSLVATGAAVVAYFYCPDNFAALYAKLIITGYLVVTNIVVIRAAKRLKSAALQKHVRTTFQDYLYTIDLPSFVCLAVLLVYGFVVRSYSSAETPHRMSEFISGSAAVVVIVTQFRFGVSFLFRVT